MSKQGMTIAEAAKSLGLSSRTVRRYVKSGKIRAEMTMGSFGQEYRIKELPVEFRKERSLDKTFPQSTGQTPVQTSVQMIEIIRELQEKNLALAAQLGVTTERIRGLEKDVKLLTAARQPWWRKLLGKAD